MKKSEALEKLKKQLWLLGVPDLSDYDAESLLRFVEEELEMLPPPVDFTKDLGTGSVHANYYRGFWEPEDD